MRRGLWLVSIIGSFAALAGTAGAAGPSADYRFEDSYESSRGSAQALTPEGPPGMCPQCAEFAKVKVKGKREGVWSWPEGDGLRLSGADEVLGRDGDSYTIAMLVKLDDVSGYRKLVDFDDRTQDTGWYVFDGALHASDVSDFDFSKGGVQANKWRQLVLTRSHSGLIRGFVDGKKIDKGNDLAGHVALGETDKLHFLVDDSGDEHSGGMIARLRVWKDALPPKKIKRLGA